MGGCTILVGTSGLTGGGPPADAGAGDAPQADVRGETGGDGGGIHDAPSDAPAGDGGLAGEAGSWCASQGQHFFCADFDEGSATAGWSSVDLQATQGMLGLSPQYVSPPTSFLSSTPAHSSGSMEARVVESVPTVPSHVHAEFDMFPCTAMTTGYYEVAKIHAYSTGFSGGVDVDISGTEDIVVDEYGDDGGELVTDLKPSPGYQLGRWNHVALDVVLDPSAGSVTLVLDRATAPSVSQSGMRTLTPGTTNVDFVLGLWSGGGNDPACEVDFDDVILDYQ